MKFHWVRSDPDLSHVRLFRAAITPWPERKWPRSVRYPLPHVNQLCSLSSYPIGLKTTESKTIFTLVPTVSLANNKKLTELKFGTEDEIAPTSGHYSAFTRILCNQQTFSAHTAPIIHLRVSFMNTMTVSLQFPFPFWKSTVRTIKVKQLVTRYSRPILLART